LKALYGPSLIYRAQFFADVLAMSEEKDAEPKQSELNVDAMLVDNAIECVSKLITFYCDCLD